LIKAVFSPFGRCDLALDGCKGIDLFKRAHEEGRPYDVVFLDVVMPGISGLETLDCLRQIEREKNISGEAQAKVLVITGYNDPKIALRTFDKDIERYLPKPFKPREIIDAVRAMSDEMQALASAR
jgi:two-component system, chemotaxis family, chemotaxis protein CheY